MGSLDGRTEREYEARAVTDGQYAIALALHAVANAIAANAHAIHRLGNADAATPMGALEALGKEIHDSRQALIEALYDMKGDQ
jgi:hypothetical protein